MAPPRPPPPLTLHRTVRGADYEAFLTAFNDSASMAACQDAAGDMEGLAVSAWATDVDALPPVTAPPGAPPPPCPPPSDITTTHYRRMVFSPVVNEPWLPKLSVFQVQELHTLEGRAGGRAPAVMRGTAHLRWASWAKPAHVLDSVILARPVVWKGEDGEDPSVPGVALELSVAPHLPPWAVGPIKRLVLAGIADMFRDFSTRSLAWAADAVGAELVEGEAGAAGAVDEDGRGGGGGKAVEVEAQREDAAAVAAEA
jgi:hypothetical protein